MIQRTDALRRKWLLRIVQGFSVTGLSLLAYPFLKALFPGSSNRDYLEVDLTELQPGEHKKVLWLGRSVIVLRRFNQGPSIAAAKDATQNDQNALKDPDSTLSVQPKYTQNKHRSRSPDVFVFYSNCTHLGCEVSVLSDPVKTEIICPCHQSRFDDAGRVLQGAVALYNLEIPDYTRISAQRIRLQSSAA
ncbi:MAG: ubiquinol-cytochrome c reductase iron-sulfur subunit [Gammaproteobacteria bacterium]|jgi:ubiquinol-cytochrome c reductase iron-sulfur subunit|nr:ubiquinol-cytochrome c reductase iron-sulfur subunit [Gammaproteobacteria bacterium]MBT5202813.1 ubiquinol-cytochrome c reductase iron-sulfur subunit [Gammaproteobacteria bacterium]MBT5601025.1 ubiquinol-cytochrome c reductase iron-sulfur subunit [Gammaproteobacteria bacterium]MBT6244634.1 ubiquinol-cytochrome c reductase iron-sulfur subunit [Gammaproteobacteria bacterium]